MKRKILLSSIITIALCICLIGGTTFALFTSKVKTSIAVTSGNVDVLAVINTDSDNFTGISIGDTTTRVSVNTGGAPTLTFANGGTAVLTQDKLEINRLTPGDSVSFYIDVTDAGNIAVKYRIEMSKAEGVAASDAELTSKLEFYVEALKADGTYTAPELFTFDETSNWYSFAEGSTHVEKAFRITVVFPTTLTDAEYDALQDTKSKDVTFVVTAVQANGAN